MHKKFPSAALVFILVALPFSAFAFDPGNPEILRLMQIQLARGTATTSLTEAEVAEAQRLYSLIETEVLAELDAEAAALPEKLDRDTYVDSDVAMETLLGATEAADAAGFASTAEKMTVIVKTGLRLKFRSRPPVPSEATDDHEEKIREILSRWLEGVKSEVKLAEGRADREVGRNPHP